MNIEDELKELSLSWCSEIVTLQGEEKDLRQEQGDAVGFLVRLLHKMSGQEIVDAMPKTVGTWNVHSWCSNGERLVVITLFKIHVPVWAQPDSREFAVRISAYGNDMSPSRLEIALSGYSLKPELLRILTNLVMLAKLKAN